MDFYTRSVNRLSVLLPYIRNKYIIILLGVLVWIAFFDRYDWGTRARTAFHIHKLENDRTHYQREIQRLKLERNLLQTNLQEVERIAREQYLMKRDNEDVFLVQMDSTGL